MKIPLHFSLFTLNFYGGVAQLGEHLPCKQGVKGSIPFISTNFERRCFASWDEIAEVDGREKSNDSTKSNYWF